MNSIKKLVLLPALALVFSVFAVPVYAHEGHDHGDDDSSSQGATDDSSSRKRGRDANKVEDSATHRSSSHNREEAAKLRGAELLAAAKASHTAKSKTERQKVCKVRKQGIENRSSRIVTAAERHQARIDGILTQVVAYQTDKNLAVANWDTLLAAANATKAESAASVAALKAVQPSIDCNSETVATDIANFKAAAEQARNDLKGYKQAVKALLTAVREAKPSATTEGQ